MTADMLPIVARVFPPGCGWPGCLHHYYRPAASSSGGGEPVIAGCICVAWPDARGGAHVVAVNPLCEGHHSVMEMIEDAAAVLCMRGYLDPEGDEIPPEIVADLLDLYLAGQCGLCPGWPSPDNLAEHLLARKQEILTTARRYARVRAMLEVWLYIHVPMTFALLAAVTAHIVSVFFF